MFISKARGYYDRSGQQHSGRGLYLALFSFDRYSELEELKASCPVCQMAKMMATYHWSMDRASYQRGIYHANCSATYNACPDHTLSQIGCPRYPNGKEMLWAIVRQCALHQLGAWMLGSINIGGQRIAVSGPIGSDGLPMAYHKLTKRNRERLVQVPEDIASIYWANNGHNSIESTAANALRQWALSCPELGVSNVR